MKDTDRDTTNHKLWLYYTPGIALSQSSLTFYVEELNNLCADRDMPAVPSWVVIVYPVSTMVVG